MPLFKGIKYFKDTSHTLIPIKVYHVQKYVRYSYES